ncbi:MAG: energy-coupling factor ABC transporter permease [Holophagaceae bacterium]|nr:energy-coupling factor ABC transporter permease [Holophagaceae bacterium]
MADALLSPAVGTTMCAISASINVLAVNKIKREELCEKKIPIMAVLGAFVFATQMINFAIPGTGSSGHIGGGILLAALIGAFPALLSISAVLIIQCLFFADGGLLAIGCNIFNLGVIPCLVVYPLVFRSLVCKSTTTGRITFATIASAVIALQLGAFCVVLETLFSGITSLPFATFTLLMQPIHLAIGIVEGIVTAAILCFVYKFRPEILESTIQRATINKSIQTKWTLVILACATLLLGGIASLFVSSAPDGLEWAIWKTTGVTELEANGKVSEVATAIQDSTTIMPDYNFREPGEGKAGKPLAGLLGGTMTLFLAGACAYTISAIKKRGRKKQTAC